MSDKHPYAPAPGHIAQVINHLRNSFPNVVNVKTLKTLGIASNNESRVINILRFLGILDEEGNKSDLASRVFSIHDDATFSQEFGQLVFKAYSDLFELHGDNAWMLSKDALITFFRSSDESTAGVGKLQATTFQLLAAFSGYGEIPESKSSSNKSGSGSGKTSKTKPKSDIATKSNSLETDSLSLENKKKDFGLTVRIEINLPSDGDQETYDRIFKSIRENLLDG